MSNSVKQGGCVVAVPIPDAVASQGPGGLSGPALPTGATVTVDPDSPDATDIRLADNVDIFWEGKPFKTLDEAALKLKDWLADNPLGSAGLVHRPTQLELDRGRIPIPAHADPLRPVVYDFTGVHLGDTTLDITSGAGATIHGGDFQPINGESVRAVDHGAGFFNLIIQGGLRSFSEHGDTGEDAVSIRISNGQVIINPGCDIEVIRSTASTAPGTRAVAVKGDGAFAILKLNAGSKFVANSLTNSEPQLISLNETAAGFSETYVGDIEAQLINFAPAATAGKRLSLVRTSAAYTGQVYVSAGALMRAQSTAGAGLSELVPIDIQGAALDVLVSGLSVQALTPWPLVQAAAIDAQTAVKGDITIDWSGLAGLPAAQILPANGAVLVKQSSGGLTQTPQASQVIDLLFAASADLQAGGLVSILWGITNALDGKIFSYNGLTGEVTTLQEGWYHLRYSVLAVSNFLPLGRGTTKVDVSYAGGFVRLAEVFRSAVGDQFLSFENSFMGYFFPGDTFIVQGAEVVGGGAPNEVNTLSGGYFNIRYFGL